MYQRLILVGNLGRDPEMQYTASGVPLTNFPLATSRKWTDTQGQVKEETTWFRVSVWGQQAEVCNEYLAKGRKVLVEGTLIIDPRTGGPRLYERKDGTPGVSFEVRATTVRFLTPQGQGNGAGPRRERTAGREPVTEEELPF